MPRYRIDAHTEARYITAVEADTPEEARREATNLIRKGDIEPLVLGITRIDVTEPRPDSL